MPVLNEIKYISNSIRSVLNQSFDLTDIEIIISDGGSSDGTIEKIKHFQASYSNIHLLNNPYKIVSAGFNLALSIASSDYILRVDGHSELPPNYISDVLVLMKDRNSDIAGGCIKTISSNLIGKAISISQSSKFGVGGVSFRNSSLTRVKEVDTLAFGIHRRELFSNLGGYDEDLVCNQDDEFNFRAKQAGKKIWMDPAIKTIYHSRSGYMKLFKQYFKYGLFKVRVLQKRGKLISLRHIIPSIFILGLILTFITGIGMNQWIYFNIFVIVYSSINIIASILGSISLKLFPLIFFANIVLHTSYGLGFIWGIFKFINTWNDKDLKDTHFNKEQFLANSF